MRPKAKNFEDLEAWRAAHDLVLSVYRFSATFPKGEEYGLKSQIRRSAVSVSANIAEGFKKMGLRDKLRYYNIAQGSLEECRYYLILVKDLGYGDPETLISKVRTAQHLLGAYIRQLKRCC